jgi:hypothetical protein
MTGINNSGKICSETQTHTVAIFINQTVRSVTLVVVIMVCLNFLRHAGMETNDC